RARPRSSKLVADLQAERGAPGVLELNVLGIDLSALSPEHVIVGDVLDLQLSDPMLEKFLRDREVEDMPRMCVRVRHPLRSYFLERKSVDVVGEPRLEPEVGRVVER